MKQFKLIAIFTITVCMMGAVCACSSDDDDSGSGSTTAGVIDKSTGLRVKGVGNHTIYYADDGRIDHISWSSRSRWDFTYNPNKIIRGNDEEDVINVDYNGSGYLSGMSWSFTEHEGGTTYTINSRLTFSYDGSGHLIKLSGSGSDVETKNGQRYESTTSGSYTLTWKNNYLMQVVMNNTTKSTKEGNMSDTETWTFAYDENYENVFCQWTPSIIEWFTDREDIEAVLAYVGLMGIGPKILPSSAVYHYESDEDGRTYSGDRPYSYRYGLNSDGSVAYTSVNSTRYNFSYDYSETTRAISEQDETPQQMTTRNLPRLFKHLHRFYK